MIEKMTEKEYRSHPAISRSELWKMSETPEKFRYAKDNPNEPTDALIFGQLFHKLVLEPETFAEEFAVEPNADGRTKEGKAIKAEFALASIDKTVVTSSQYAQAIEMRDAVLKNPKAIALLKGQHEVPYFWTDEETGEECKCRADCVTDLTNSSIIIDLKSASDAAPDAFQREAIKYGYHFQTAFYKSGMDKVRNKDHRFVFIVVEKKPPYAVNIVEATPEFINYGEQLMRKFLAQYHECKQTGNWWGYNGPENKIGKLDLPPWLAKQVDNNNTEI